MTIGAESVGAVTIGGATIGGEGCKGSTPLSTVGAACKVGAAICRPGNGANKTGLVVVSASWGAAISTLNGRGKVVGSIGAANECADSPFPCGTLEQIFVVGASVQNAFRSGASVQNAFRSPKLSPRNRSRQKLTLESATAGSNAGAGKTSIFLSGSMGLSSSNGAPSRALKSWQDPGSAPKSGSCAIHNKLDGSVSGTSGWTGFSTRANKEGWGANSSDEDFSDSSKTISSTS